MFRLISVFLLMGFFIVSVGQTRTIKDIPVAELTKRIEASSDTIFVVNFWATWCQPCVKEIPEFNKIPRIYQQKPVKVIMANLDFPNQKDSRLLPFLQNNRVIHEVIMVLTPRGGEWINSVDESWSGAIPATLIWHNGQKYFHEGETNNDQIRTWIERIL